MDGVRRNSECHSLVDARRGLWADGRDEVMSAIAAPRYADVHELLAAKRLHERHHPAQCAIRPPIERDIVWPNAKYGGALP